MSSSDILIRREASLGHITLNRPRALNALTHHMCASMLEALRAWADDPTIRACAIDAVQGRAFCAGGDIRAIYDMGKRGDGSAQAFFTTEYALNAAIGHFPKPIIALIDEIVMGGGVGVSVHASYRAVSENVIFAMPETAIGLFPDVGTSYVLPRLPGNVGMYLALTGERVTGADMMHAGLATHFVRSEHMREIVPRLASGEAPDAVMEDLAADPGPSLLARHRDSIDRAFSAMSVEAILDALEVEGEWGAQTIALLHTRSPTSLKLTFQLMHEAMMLDFDSCQRLEYRLMIRLLEGPDFYEGGRAAVIDKDQRPHWRPALLSAVSDAEIAGYFAGPDVTELSS